MGLDRTDVIFKLAKPQKLDAITLFQAISGFKNSSHRSRWDRHDLNWQLQMSLMMSVISTSPFSFD